MRALGIVIALASMIALVVSINLNTSVYSPIGSVNNLGLMNDKQNYLIVSALGVLIGLILALFAGQGLSSSTKDEPAIRKSCPACAEEIKVEALKCRYCGYEYQPDAVNADLAERAYHAELERVEADLSRDDIRQLHQTILLVVLIGIGGIAALALFVAYMKGSSEQTQIAKPKAAYATAYVPVELSPVVNNFSDSALSPPPAPFSVPPADDVSDLCEARINVRVAPVGTTENFLEVGTRERGLTQYWKTSDGVDRFCFHGGSCYPAHIRSGDALISVMSPHKCRVDFTTGEPDGEEILYSLTLDRSQVSAAELRQNDIAAFLLDKGMCSACASNAAASYQKLPRSSCGLYVAKILQNDPIAVSMASDENACS